MCEPCEPPQKKIRCAEAFFSRGPGTYSVKAPLPLEAREKLVSRLRSANICGVVLLRGGVSACRNDTDHEELFRQESYFSYLFGVLEPDCWATIELPSGRSTLFVPRLAPEYAVWMGEIKSAESFQRRYQVDAACYTDEVSSVVKTSLKECASPGGDAAAVYTLSGTNSDSGSNIASSLPTATGVPPEATVVDDVLYDILADCRTRKSESELELMQYVSWVTSAAHVEVMREVRQGTPHPHSLHTPPATSPANLPSSRRFVLA